MVRSSRRWAAAPLLTLALAWAACGSDSTGPEPSDNDGDANTIEMRDFSFFPASLTVQAGTSVTWRNVGEVPHNSTSVTEGLWQSADLQPDQTFSRTFTASGTFAYECTLHPGMEGTITVQ